MAPISAVLTGDLIDSMQQDAARVEQTMSLIEELAPNLGAGTGFARFRGDGWQLHLPVGGRALWAFLRILATLRAANALETRVSIGLGADTSGPVADLSSARGEAFLISGRGLDGMARRQRARIGLPSGLHTLPGEQTELVFQSLLDLADFQAERWSREQAEAVRLMLETVPYRTATDIAQHLGITRQAADARLKGAGAAALGGAAWAFFQSFHGGSWDDD